MTSHEKRGHDDRGFDWAAIVRTSMVQVAVLLALAGAFVVYVNWSSEVALEEFLAADKSAVAAPEHHRPSPMSLRATRVRFDCGREI